jgi:4-hydroxyphenylpyruvate dioxygenase
VLFYRSIFDLRKSPMVDVLDPAGLVRSQVVENAAGTLRLTLNGAENSRTFAGQFVTKTFGSSIQHIAFASADIFATAEAMGARGFTQLRFPASYYDDLDARFGLDPALLARLRGHNVLYDRDDGGEFFQFYGRSLGEGFFFEIVQRVGGYAGYGAPNAPFRIAAQRRAMREMSLESAES